MTETALIRRYLARVIIALACMFLGTIMAAQSTGYKYFYRVYFSDKGGYIPSSFSASQLLSEKAITRREKSGIPAPDYIDLPVWPDYLSLIKSMGYTLHCTSRWLNTALFKTTEPADYTLISKLSFVAGVKVVRQPSAKGNNTDKLDFPVDEAENPPFDRPITMLNGYPLHSSGFTGKGLLIAVLDGGFIYADQIPALSHLRHRGGIRAVYDFVNNDESVYNYHNHGTAVMSVLAGSIPGVIAGTATGADFMLLRTEDVSSEFSVEEDYWAAGAEFADSAGADIISSSLGYFSFDDASSGYKFSDFDGNTAFVTRAADIAASKGILVVSSAGNERNKTWLRIIAPSDGDSVICVGAVDGYGIISSFSSAGPSSDRQIKPDNATMGVSVPVQVVPTGVARSNGTSFSCPVLSGMSACLMEAAPYATNIDIADALHRAGNRYNMPDSLYGYGIPDMGKALEILQDKYVIIPEDDFVARPNPTTGEFEIVFRDNPGRLILEIFSSAGKMIFKKDFSDYAGRSLRMNALCNMEQGLYLVRLMTGTGIYIQKVIKLSD